MVTQAAPPRSVGLLSFEATALQNTVQLEWQTATELNTLGYIIKRSVNGGAFISLPDIGEPGFIDADGNPAGVVLAEGGPAEGASYQELDGDVQTGNQYTYKLFEIENDGNEEELDEQVVSFGQAPTHTPTAQVTTANTAVPTSISTSVLIPTSMVPPNVTPQATNTTAAPPSTQANATSGPPAAAATVFLASTSGNTGVATTELVLANQTDGQGQGESAANPLGVNVAAAQEEETPTAVFPSPLPETTGYPPLSQEEPTPEEPGAVPATPILSEESLEEESYPAATQPTGQEGSTTPVVPVIGSEANNQEGAAPAENIAEGREARLGRIYLWSGFLLSLLIFVTTVVATILLFTRKRTQ